jgi:hypothetical protein
MRRYTFCAFTKNYYDNQIKEKGVAGNEIRTKFWSENMKERSHFNGKGLIWRIILKGSTHMRYISNDYKLFVEKPERKRSIWKALA